MLSRISPLLLLTFTFTVYGCSKKKEAPPAPIVPVAVAAPEGLLAELSIPNPGTTWESVRASLGGPAMMMPASGGLMAATVFDLPPTSAELFDMQIPALGAMIEDRGRVAAVLAFHVKDGLKLAEIASTGEGARYTKAADRESGVLLLEPKEANSGPAIGISGNYLTVASRSSDLTEYAPFVTRTLPSRAVPKGDIVAVLPRAGLSKLVDLAKMGWEARKGGGAGLSAMLEESLGDSADAELGLLESRAEKLFATLEDLDDARLSLTLEGGFAQLHLGAKAGAGAALKFLSGMASGDAKPLLELPAESAVAVLYRDTAEARNDAATEQIEAFAKRHGDDLSAANKGRIEEALEGWARARGDWMSVGAIWSEGGIDFVARAAAADGELLDTTIGKLFALSNIPVFAKPVEAVLGPFQLGSPSAKAGVKTVRLSRKSATTTPALINPEALPEKLDLAWTVKDGALSAAMGRDAQATLAKGSGSKLSDIPELSNMVNSLEGDISFALLARPRKIISAMTGQPVPEEAPLLLSFGRRDKAEIWLRVDASDLVIRDLMMLASGF